MQKANNKKEDQIENDWSFTKKNYLLFFLSLIIIIFGYMLMYLGGVDGFLSLKLSSVFLIFGYCVMIPLSILYKN
tara:strand:- start:8518 stop:8742 length:225 start_codon:yes stop_codon:yes gene_type:complete